MNIIYYVVLALFTASSLINHIKWSRIAQREHYVPSYVTKIYFRWVRLVPYNGLLFFVSIVLFFSSLWSPYPAIALAVFTILTPMGLSFKSRTSKVNKTERLNRLNVVYFTLVIFLSVASLLLEWGYFLAMIVNLFSFYVYDLALRITKNYEKNKTQHFVQSASQKLNNFKGPIIAITGSYSKTTTKNVLNQILSRHNQSFTTPESFNNRLGIAKSINDDLQNTDEISIIEMGTYGFGEIREICSWVKPHISVITGIAPVHLERMKSLENILEAKSEIVDFAGSVVINGDDNLLLNQARLWAAQKMVIDCSTTSVKAAVYVSFDSGVHKIYIGGEYICELNAPEILQLSIALSVGVLIALDMDVKNYLNNQNELTKTDHRQSILKGNLGQTIIDNSFNSNPISYRSSLKTLAEIDANGNKYLITPGMVELGSEQFSQNYEFAFNASSIISEALVVGYTNRGSLMLGFEDGGVPVKFFRNRELAVSYLNSVINEDDAVLFENDLPDHHP
jgi:UDP-N-acetylmuramoyl-tripeptide--D-alanyl-D-alanine ligase